METPIDETLCGDQSHLNADCQLSYGHKGCHEYQNSVLAMGWRTVLNNDFTLIRVAGEYPACNLARRSHR